MPDTLTEIRRRLAAYRKGRDIHGGHAPPEAAEHYIEDVAQLLREVGYQKASAETAWKMYEEYGFPESRARLAAENERLAEELEELRAANA